MVAVYLNIWFGLKEMLSFLEEAWDNCAQQGSIMLMHELAQPWSNKVNIYKLDIIFLVPPPHPPPPPSPFSLCCVWCRLKKREKEEDQNRRREFRTRLRLSYFCSLNSRQKFENVLQSIVSVTEWFVHKAFKKNKKLN